MTWKVKAADAKNLDELDNWMDTIFENGHTVLAVVPTGEGSYRVYFV